jgi:hypothetical protein
MKVVRVVGCFGYEARPLTVGADDDPIVVADLRD